MFLGKFNNLIKVETLKCANKALMRCNPQSQFNVAHLATDTGRSAGDSIPEGKTHEASASGVQNRDEHLWTKLCDVDLTLIDSNTLYAMRLPKSYNSHKSGKAASRKKYGVKKAAISVKSLALGNSWAPLSNGVDLRPFNAELQQRAHESSANSYYDGEKFKSAHTDRTTVSFECPLPRRIKKKESTNKLFDRKMDCNSLKEEGALAAFADKPNNFGCKGGKKGAEDRKPNACGEIFECSRKVVKAPKKSDCPVGVSFLGNIQLTKIENQRYVSVLMRPDVVQRFQNVLDSVYRKIYPNPERYHVFHELLAEVIAANLAHISPEWLSIRRLRPQSIDYGRNASFGVRKYSEHAKLKKLSNRVANRKMTLTKLKDPAQKPDCSELRISDAELLRLALRDKSVDRKTDYPSSAVVDRNVGSKQNGTNLDEESNIPPASFFTSLLPPSETSATDKAGSGSIVEEIQTLAIKGGNVDVHNSEKEPKSEAVTGYKPLPGQVCCSKEKAEVVNEKPESLAAPLSPPQICCPPKEKSVPPESTKPSIQKLQSKASEPPNETTPKPAAAGKHELSHASKKTALRSVVADDPSAFNCCLSIVEPHKVAINNCPMPEMHDEDVIVKMHTVAVGPSDIYLFDRGVSEPVALGHEGSGVVFKVGKNVRHLRPGDTVAVEPGIACGCCSYCKAGRYNLCASMKFKGLLQTYCSHPAHFCYKVPKELDAMHAALTHPVAMALHACRRANVCVGSTVMVLGACPFGLSVVMAARAMGADKILVMDTVEKNLKLAYEFCADKTILALPEMTSEILAEKVLLELNGNPNVVIDCCGCSRTVNLAGLALKPGGYFVLAGCQTSCANVPILAMLAKEICACYSFRTSNEFTNAMGLIASRRANVSKLITHKTEFCEAQQGFEWALNEEKSGAIKVLVNWPNTEKH